MARYKEDLVERYWEYQQTIFPESEEYFDQVNTYQGRPPVFLRSKACHNVMVRPGATPEENEYLFHLLPAWERHKWFGSMHSSQALAQSVLGNLAVYGHLYCLASLLNDEGRTLFGNAALRSESFSMEHKVTYLGEPQPTSLDSFFCGDYQVAIECKFTEAEVGPCSRPLLSKNASNYATDWCNGSYSHQLGRTERCSLTKNKSKYWQYIPLLFKWKNGDDIKICPLNKTYQLVRNVLAACVRSDGTVCPEKGHAVLIYDERNPAFQHEGNGLHAFNETKDALIFPELLRKCSWQTIVAHMKCHDTLPWLTEQLNQKYGLM